MTVAVKSNAPIPVIIDPPLTREQRAALNARAMRAAGCVKVSRMERPARGRPNASALRREEEAA